MIIPINTSKDNNKNETDNFNYTIKTYQLKLDNKFKMGFMDNKIVSDLLKECMDLKTCYSENLSYEIEKKNKDSIISAQISDNFIAINNKDDIIINNISKPYLKFKLNIESKNTGKEITLSQFEENKNNWVFSAVALFKKEKSLIILSPSYSLSGQSYKNMFIINSN